MSGYRFLLDANVFNLLTDADISSQFFRNYCRIPDEVLFEVRGKFPDSLDPYRYPMSSEVLTLTAKVMEGLENQGIGLINLYQNKGAADPLLIACAMDANQSESTKLFRFQWVAVTDDAQVRAEARKHDVETMSGIEFLSKLRQPAI